jgi:hypothetical protein
MAGSQVGQGLIRFDSIFGTGAGQVPTNAVIRSAKLILYTPLSPTGLDYGSDDVFRLHRMIIDWNDSATWNSLNAGVSVDGVEAAGTATFSLAPVVDGAPAIFDVTSDIELFRTGTPNRGWLIRPSTTGTGNGWTFASSEATADVTQRPRLEIIYTNSFSPYTLWATSKNLVGAAGAPTADPDNDGVINVDEFAYNMEPLLSDAYPVTPTGTNGLPAAHYLTGFGGKMEIQFIRRKGSSAAGLTYATQFADEVVNPSWVNGQTPIVTSINSDWERVVVRDSSSGRPHRFGKVTVTLQQ